MRNLRSAPAPLRPPPPVPWTPARGTLARIAGAALSASLVLGGARAAEASPAFPGVVQSHLGLTSAPDCTLCHAGTPGLGTATTPFATTLRSRGATAGNEQSVKTALDALAAERKDSDGDGTPDIEELKAGDDPNVAGGEAVIPEYGCTLGRTSSDTGGAGAAMAALFGVVLVASRRRARRG